MPTSVCHHNHRAVRLPGVLGIPAVLPALPAVAVDRPLMSEAARPPAVLEYEVVKAWPHDRGAFTQGLIYRDGFIYESTGLNGRSSLRKVSLESGEVVQHLKVANEYFAEGLIDWKDRLVQITWQSKIGFTYDLKTFEAGEPFHYGGEGWGITHDSRRLDHERRNLDAALPRSGYLRADRHAWRSPTSASHWPISMNSNSSVDGYSPMSGRAPASSSSIRPAGASRPSSICLPCCRRKIDPPESTCSTA